MPDRDLADLIRRRLFELGVTAAEIARRSGGVAPAETVRGLARGRRIRVGDGFARALARALQVTEYRVRRAAGLPVRDVPGQPTGRTAGYPRRRAAGSVSDRLVPVREVASSAVDGADAPAGASRRPGAAELVRFPGQDELPDRFPLSELSARCAVEAVDLLGVADGPDLVLRTRGHVRPEYRGGVLVLPVTAWDDGEVCPFESPTARACCSDH